MGKYSIAYDESELFMTALFLCNRRNEIFKQMSIININKYFMKLKVNVACIQKLFRLLSNCLSVVIIFQL